jgi:hypothetical protein
MPSPFPGMNPYLEHAASWQDFHTTFIAAIRVALNAIITPKYFARIEEHLLIQDLEDDSRRGFAYADVSVAQLSHATGAAVATATDPRMAEPKHVWEVEYIEEHLRFIEIFDRESLKVITVIELLSPTNKLPGKDRDQFIAKRHKLLKSDVHYVEIDLRRLGPQLPWKDLEPCDYYLLVNRVETRPRADIWPFGVRDPIPLLRVPLGNDPDAIIDLKAILDAEYDKVMYGLTIYNREPEPPLKPADREWAQEIIRAHVKS